MAIINIYVDDSDTMQRGNFVCLAGYALPTSAGQEFARSWHAKAREHGLPGAYLHTSDFLAGKGLYEERALTKEQRVEIVRDFLRLIHKEIPLAIGVPLTPAH